MTVMDGSMEERQLALREEIGAFDDNEMTVGENRAANEMLQFNARHLEKLAKSTKGLSQSEEIILQMRKSDEERRRQIAGVFIQQVADSYERHGGLNSGTAAYLFGMMVVAALSIPGSMDTKRRAAQADRRKAVLEKNEDFQARQERVDNGKCPYRAFFVPRSMQMWLFNKEKARNEGRLSKEGFRTALTPDTIGLAYASVYVNAYKDALAAQGNPEKLAEVRSEFMRSRVNIYQIASSDGVSVDMLENHVLPMALERLHCDRSGAFKASGMYYRVGKSAQDIIPKDSFHAFMQNIGSGEFGLGNPFEPGENRKDKRSAERSSKHRSEKTSSRKRSAEPTSLEPEGNYEEVAQSDGSTYEVFECDPESGSHETIDAEWEVVTEDGDADEKSDSGLKSPDSNGRRYVKVTCDDGFVRDIDADELEMRRSQKAKAEKLASECPAEEYEILCEWDNYGSENYEELLDRRGFHKNVEQLVSLYEGENPNPVYMSAHEAEYYVSSAMGVFFGTENMPSSHMYFETENPAKSKADFVQMMKTFENGDKHLDMRNEYFTDFVYLNIMRNSIDPRSFDFVTDAIVDQIGKGLCDVARYRGEKYGDTFDDPYLVGLLERGERVMATEHEKADAENAKHAVRDTDAELQGEDGRKRSRRQRELDDDESERESKSGSRSLGE